MPLPVATETPEVADGTVADADAVVTGVAVVTAEDVATPTGYIPMLCVTSPSPVVDDTVEVPVVPELGDGLKTEETNNVTRMLRRFARGIAAKNEKI